MSVIKTSPYYHPTQIVLVDDDIDFLGNLSLQLDADLAYLLFDSTQKALSYLNERETARDGRDRFFRAPAAGGLSTNGEGGYGRLEIDTAALCREMQASDRFAQISVALVDYAMPQMNGLEFCERIHDPHIKKILFTGVATESVAVDAFNQGIIDQYIRKHEHSVYDTLNAAIRKFQCDYIRDLFVAAADVFPLNVPELLSDSGVARLLTSLRTSHGLAEYYLAPDQRGFLFADAAGQLRRLVLQSAAEARNQAEVLQESGLRSDQLRAIAANTLVADPAVAGMERDAVARAAEQLVSPAQRLPESAGLGWAVFDAIEIGGHLRPSYSEFLEWLDTVGYSLM